MTTSPTPTVTEGNPPAAALTARQLEVLEFIADYWRENLAPPSLRDIQREFGFGGTNGAVCHVRPLVRAGLLVPPPTAGPRVSRSLVVAGLREAVAGAAEAFFRDLLGQLGRDADG